MYWALQNRWQFLSLSHLWNSTLSRNNQSPEPKSNFNFPESLSRRAGLSSFNEYIKGRIIQYNFKTVLMSRFYCTIFCEARQYLLSRIEMCNFCVCHLLQYKNSIGLMNANIDPVNNIGFQRSSFPKISCRC